MSESKSLAKQHIERIRSLLTAITTESERLAKSGDWADAATLYAVAEMLDTPAGFLSVKPS